MRLCNGRQLRSQNYQREGKRGRPTCVAEEDAEDEEDDMEAFLNGDDEGGSMMGKMNKNEGLNQQQN